MTVSNFWLVAAVILFAVAGVLDLLVCLDVVAIKRPITSVLIAAGLACFAYAFVAG
ncbi:MAG TPA: hypothetical protein VGH94_13680 [Acidimicrobiales bacterium]|jgi:hypothetical protein